MGEEVEDGELIAVITAALMAYTKGNGNKTLVVKNGSKGSIMVSDGVRRAVPALLNPEPVDCIGAGDSFNAGFVAAFVKGCPLPDCQDNGNLTGAISTTAAGGTGAFSDSRRTAGEAADSAAARQTGGSARRNGRKKERVV